MSSFDIGLEQAGQQNLENQRIAEQQRVQRQNTVGAQLLDAINNASNIKPQTKDENGNIIHNPEYDTAQTAKQKLLQQYTTLMSPQQHASFADHLHGLIFGHADHRPQQPALSPNSSPNEPPAPAVAPGQAVPVPAPPPHPMAPLPQDHPVHAITKGIKELGSHLSAFAHPLPAQAQPDTSLIAKYYRDPAEVAHERQMEIWGERGQNALKVQELKNEYLKQQLQARPPRLLSQTTIPDLLEQIKVDPTMQIFAPDGHEVSVAQLSEMPAGTIAREFRAGTQIFYALGDQNSKTLNVGGQIYQIPSLGPINPEDSHALGTATSAIPKPKVFPGMNPGEVVNVTPQPMATPGMTGGPVASPTTTPPPAPAGEPPNPSLHTRPNVTPTIPPPASQVAETQKLNQKRSQSRQIPTPQGQPMPPAFAKGTMLSQGRSAQPVVSAMSVMAANVFGGNGDKPIWDNAWMYDKPELRKALNNALTLNALANPGTEDNPSLMQTLATAVGTTQWSQEQINAANVQARQELQRLGGDAALQQFAREAALQEDLSALRTATKASAAQGSIRTLVRAAPVYNISSAQDFRNQLGATLNTAYSSMKGYPAINPEYMKWWERGVSAAKGGPTSSNAPKTPSGNQQVYEMNGKRYTYNGTGAKSDLKNYTEVPSGAK